VLITTIEIIIIIFSTQVVKIPRGLKRNKKIKTGWDGYVSIASSTGKISWNRIEDYYYYICKKNLSV